MASFGANDESASPTSGLLEKLHADCLTSAEFAQLESALSNDEKLRWQFVHDIHLRAGLIKWAKSHGVASEQSLIELLNKGRSETTVASVTELLERGVLGESDDSSSDSMWSGPGLLIKSVAFTTLLVALFLISRPLIFDSSDSKSTSATHDSLSNASLGDGVLPVHNEDALSESRNVVARVVWTTNDTTWSNAARPTDFLLRLRPGDIIGTNSGFVKIEFSDGARLILHSPSLLQVTSATSAHLIRGQVAGRAQNGNFTLSTPSASVVDIGTEFGVGVNAQGTAVTVFEGEVHVHSMLRSTTAGPFRRLTEGMSLKVAPNGTTLPVKSKVEYRREFSQGSIPLDDPNTISLLDLIAGQNGPQQVAAGSIDPLSGYWGRLPWADPNATRKRRGDTQYTPTHWNAAVDGVFIPRSNAREMQIDSDGHVVYLPPNSGETWGPIWARRRSDLDTDYQVSLNRNDAWGRGKLERVIERLGQSQSGILGLHANVGITFDLDAIRSSNGNHVEKLEASVSNLGASLSGESDASLVDLRIFVDGKLRYSRIAFCFSDGEDALSVAVDDGDRFVTVVVTDAGGDSSLDHAVLIDPVFRLQTEPSETATSSDAPR